MLRRRAYVDPAKIAVVGVGTGANAALIMARNDPALAALVAAGPVDGFDSAFANRVGSDHRWLPPLRPMFDLVRVEHDERLRRGDVREQGCGGDAEAWPGAWQRPDGQVGDCPPRGGLLSWM